jgi:hypothetical protein
MVSSSWSELHFSRSALLLGIVQLFYPIHTITYPFQFTVLSFIQLSLGDRIIREFTMQPFKPSDGCLALHKLMANGSNGFNACPYFEVIELPLSCSAHV